jgi:hypothetical protein
MEEVQNSCQFNLLLNPRLQPIHSCAEGWISSSLPLASARPLYPHPPAGAQFWKFNFFRKREKRGGIPSQRSGTSVSSMDVIQDPSNAHWPGHTEKLPFGPGIEPDRLVYKEPAVSLR